MIKKSCFKCESVKVRKDGKMRGKQRYRCVNCGYVFQNASKKISSEILWGDYTKGKQTYQQLSEKYHLSIPTIQKKIDSAVVVKKGLLPQETVLIMDTTYFGRGYGIMVFRSHELKKNLLWKEVSWETVQAYKDGVKELQEQGWRIKAIVCDGKKGILGGFGDIPTQMCIFHQKQIIRRYITKNPRLEANKEMKEIGEALGYFSKTTIEALLEDWYRRNRDFLNERNDVKKLIHNRTLKAYRSLKYNLKYLYVFKDYEKKLNIPGTTNSLESTFGRMKQNIGAHRGLKKQRRFKVIEQFLGK